MYYIAYGSNMNVSWFEKLCPNSKLVATMLLPNYKLVFCGNDDVYATIEPHENCNVPIVMWEISDKHLKALDTYEDFPQLYRKEMLSVTMNNQQTEAMVYIMNTDKKGLPKTDYYTMLVQAYHEHQFDMTLLENAVGENHELL